MINRLTRKIEKAFFGLLPNNYLINHAVMSPSFKAANGRSPIRTGRLGESLNDFVFDRMIRNDWTDRQLRAVDKDLAKAEAASLCPTILVPRTVAVIEITEKSKSSDLVAQLVPYLGKRLIAKPTHGSGFVVFMDDPDAIRKLDPLVYCARRNFFIEKRETQYAHLQRKIIIEENISDNGVAPVDYKFFCFGGVPEFCQVDIGRFEHHHRAIFDVRTQSESLIRIGPFPRAADVKLPPNFMQMAEAAQSLAQPFDVVRVDLYSIGSKVYFSEFTFSPHAALMKVENDEDIIEMIRRVRKNITPPPLVSSFSSNAKDGASRIVESVMA